MRQKRLCTIEGCDAKHRARGYCEKHYARLDKYGSPHTVRKRRADNGEPVRFLEKAAKMITDECIVWPFSKDGDGRGRLIIDGKPVRAHRVLWEMVHGELPVRSIFLDPPDTCESVACINPRHLRLGRWSERVRYDRVWPPIVTCTVEGCDAKHRAKGYCEKHYARVDRYGSPDDRPRLRGEAHHSSKLTDAEVEAILKDPRSCRVVGKDYNVSHNLIHMVRKGERRASVGD